MPHPCVEDSAITLHRLRQATIMAPAEEGGHISPNVYFSWDSAQAEVAIAVQSAPGQLLTAEVTLQGSPRWFALNIGLGAGAFAAGDSFGLVIDASSTVPFDCQPFVRSSKEDETLDTILAEEIRLTPAGGASVMLHCIAASDPLVWAGQFHTLILPLPKQNFRLDLRDLRLLHLGSGEAAMAGQRTLTAVAV
ncbi:MAG: hypothetical protein Q7J44_15700 [Pseudotabrizicola sp.]|uniref:hypothetical protein n=1 Tax=Pseudotabrizicola sp. TaxID=2939647 RepID=UPI00271C0C8C|nr:hypothetical protein [Pseudotabrizicola sp.]MDO9639981.1 hypothetical protein [Pseudotabrizicola sp.]